MEYTPISEMTGAEVHVEVASTIDRLMREIEQKRSTVPADTPHTLRRRELLPGKFNDDYYRADYNYTLNRMTDMINSSRHHLDFLRVYDKHLLNQPTVDRADAVTRTANALANSFGGEIAGILTAGHIERLIVHEEAMANPNGIFRGYKYGPTLHLINAIKYAAVISDEETAGYINANLHAIGAIMVDRKIKDYRDVLELVDSMDSGSASLMNGAL